MLENRTKEGGEVQSSQVGFTSGVLPRKNAKLETGFSDTEVNQIKCANAGEEVQASPTAITNDMSRANL